MTLASSDTAVIWRTFERTVAADASALAIATADTTVSRERLAQQASSVAEAMRRVGVGAHDVVLVILPNSVEFVATCLAVMRLPAVAALASTRYKASELRAICTSVRPQSIVVEPGDADRVAGLMDVADEHDISVPGSDRVLRLLRVRPRQLPSALDVEARFGLPDPGSPPALIKCSSGTTGAPKAVLWTAANVRAAAANTIDTLGLGPTDTTLAPVPLSHSYGFDLGVLPMVFAGTALVVHDGFSPKAVLTELASGRVSIFLGVPEMVRLLTRTRSDPVPDLSAVRRILSSTAPLPRSWADAFRERFGASVCPHYGSSETGGITLLAPSAIAVRPGSVGRAMNNVVVEVVDDDGAAVPTGARGEVVIRGAATAAGYVHDDADPCVGGFRDGRYFTGDLGFLDADGYLHLDGSRRDVINVGGWKVPAEEVARVLRSHPAVVESTVGTSRDPHGRDRVIAAVTVRDAADEADVIAFCQARLADYKVPRRVHIVEKLPTAAIGR